MTLVEIFLHSTILSLPSNQPSPPKSNFHLSHIWTWIRLCDRGYFIKIAYNGLSVNDVYEDCSIQIKGSRTHRYASTKDPIPRGPFILPAPLSPGYNTFIKSFQVYNI